MKLRIYVILEKKKHKDFFMLKKLILILCMCCFVSSAYALEVPVDAKLDYNQGIDFYKLGMYERAIESFRSAIRACPDYIDAYYNLGIVLEYLKQDAEALNVFKQIYLRNPNDYEIIYKIAELSAKQEKYTDTTRFVNQIPETSEYYSKGKELMESIKLTTNIPEQKYNPPSKIATQTGVYENVLSPTGITTDKDGNVYVSTFSDNTIIKISMILLKF